MGKSEELFGNKSEIANPRSEKENSDFKPLTQDAGLPVFRTKDDPISLLLMAFFYNPG